MNFDASQLAAVAPIMALTIAGSILLLLESFGRGRQRAYLMPLTLASLAVTLVLLCQQWDDAATGTTVFHGMLAVDRFSALFGAVFVVGAALAALLAPAFMHEHNFEFGEFYSLLIFATLGMLILAAATDLVTIFLGVETMSIAVYVLTGSWRHQPKSAEGAMKYFMVGAFATSVLLYGMALLYGAVGSTALVDLAHATRGAGTPLPLFILGLLLVIVALGFKIAAVPFHMWAPDAYEGAPTPVTAYMAAAVKAAGFATLIRLVSTAFASPQLAFGSSGWATLLSGVAVLTMTLGNLAALRQDNIKRMLAYSSIAHAGYLLIGVVAIAVVGADARGLLIYYLVAYTFTTVGSFGVVAWIGSKHDEKLMVDDWAGLAGKHPAAALAMTIFMLSLGGIPPTAGFFGKFYVFRAALEKPSLVWLVIIAVLNSVVSVFYYLRIVTAMYFREAGREVRPLRGASVSAALIIAAVGTLALGLLPSWLVDLANAATLTP